jgi:hypothetical protein
MRDSQPGFAEEFFGIVSPLKTAIAISLTAIRVIALRCPCC